MWRATSRMTLSLPPPGVVPTWIAIGLPAGKGAAAGCAAAESVTPAASAAIDQRAWQQRPCHRGAGSMPFLRIAATEVSTLKEVRQRPRGLRLQRVGVDAGGVDQRRLDLGRQLADDVDALDRHQLGDLVDADLGLALRDQHADGQPLAILILSLIWSAMPRDGITLVEK